MSTPYDQQKEESGLKDSNDIGAVPPPIGECKTGCVDPIKSSNDGKEDDVRMVSEEDSDDSKLGQGFMSADELQEINFGTDEKPRPTYINKKLGEEVKTELIELLKE